MMKKGFYLDIDLFTFEGDGAAPAGGEGGEGGQEPGGGELQDTKDGIANHQKDPKDVVYGKSEDDNDPEGGEEPEGEDGSDDADVPPDQKLESLLESDPTIKEAFQNKIQSIIDKRFKETKQLESKVGESEPILEMLRERYDVKDNQQLMEVIEEETIEELAYKEGMDVEQYRKMRELERENSKLKEQGQTQEQQEQLNKQVQKWYDEEAELKKIYPNFDLKEWAKDDEFLGLIKSGVSVKAAYEVKNIDEIKKMTAKATESSVTKSINKRKSRPKENGTKQKQGVIVKNDAKKLTREDRMEIAKRVQRGEKIQF